MFLLPPFSFAMRLEVKIFCTCLLLQELLDETVGDTKFKQKLRYHINALQKELDRVLGVELGDNELSLIISRATEALEEAFEVVEQ